MIRCAIRLFWDVPRRAVWGWLADEAMLLSAAMAYYFAVALFPLLLVLVAVVGFVLQRTEYGKDAQQQVVEAVATQISPTVSEQLERLLSAVGDRAAVSGPLAAVMLLAVVVAVFVQFDRAFDVIWNVPRTKGRGILATLGNVAFRRLKAFLMLLGVWGLVMITFIVSLAWSGLDRYAAQVAPFLSEASGWLQQGVYLAINIGAFTLIYRFVPKAAVAWRDAVAGGVLAGVLWEVGRHVLAALLVGQRYTSAYGVIGSFMAVMLWCYFGAAVLFLGAEYVRELGTEEEHGADPS